MSNNHVGRPVIDIDESVLVKIYMSNGSVRKTAKELGVSHGTVARRISAMGISFQRVISLKAV